MRLLANGTQGPTVMPSPAAPSGTPGFAYNNEPTLGASVSTYDPDTFNVNLAEDVSILAAGGLAPDNTGADVQQKLKALRRLFGIFATDTGGAGALVVTPSPAVTSLGDGQRIIVRVAASNVGAATINVNGLGAVPILTAAGAALTGGELIAGGTADLIYNATTSSFVLVSGVAYATEPWTNSAISAAVTVETQRAEAAEALRPLLSAFTASLNSPGYLIIPCSSAPSGKFIFQWGTNSVGASSWVAFPTTFPAAALGLVVCEDNAMSSTWGDARPTIHAFQGLTQSGYTAWAEAWTGSGWIGGSIGQSFFAVGC